MSAPIDVELSSELRRLAHRYSEALQATFRERLVAVVLFGSVARGEANLFSDLDLIVVVEELPPGRFARRRLADPAQAQVDSDLELLRARGSAADFCVLLLTPQEAQKTRPLYLDLVEDAILLYDRGGFFQGILSQLRDGLRHLGARRLKMGSVRYWDLKPDLRPGEVFEL